MSQISRDIGTFKDISSNVYHQLSNIEQLLLASRADVLCHTNTVRRVLQNITRNDRDELKVLEKQFSPDPLSPLEASSNFFPETYTTRQRLPINSLVVISSMGRSSDNSRTNFYRFFYQKSPRQWCNLSISLSISRSSRFWAVTEISEELSSTNAAPSLPTTLLLQFQDYLAKAEQIDENTHFGLSINGEENVQTEGSGHHDLQAHPFSTAAVSIDTSQKILTSLDDLGCPRFLETEIIQMGIIGRPCWYASCVAGTLVLEIKFGFSSLANSDVMYNIKVLRCLRNNPHFVKFVGIVVDHFEKSLKSYLFEFPRGKWSHIDSQLTAEQNIPWGRRENLARQIVEGVKEVHSRGFVIGTLLRTPLPVLADDLDCLQFYRFRDSYERELPFVFHFPPECRWVQPLTSSASRDDHYSKVTPKSDIFQLGVLLWILAENPPRISRSPMCIRERCDLKNSACRNETHHDPIALPRLPDSIPRYYRDAVDSCRAEDPNKRPAAWRLLESFPPRSCSRTSQNSDPKPGTLDTSSLTKSFGFFSFICDICQRNIDAIDEASFHCNICNNGDFDLCMSCYDTGIHCYEENHLFNSFEDRECVYDGNSDQVIS